MKPDLEKMPKTMYATDIIITLLDQMRDDGDFQVSMVGFEKMLMGEETPEIKATGPDPIAKAHREGYVSRSEHNAQRVWNPYPEASSEHRAWDEGWQSVSEDL